jgi:uncharacterized protein
MASAAASCNPHTREPPMHLIVDTFNVLHAWGAGPDSGGRQEIQSLAALIQRSRYSDGRISLVCDGARFQGGDPAMPGSQRVLFAGGGREADALIETLISRDTGPRELVVASSDRRLQRAVRKRGGNGLASEKFLGQIIRDSANPAREPLRPAFARKTPLTPTSVDQWLNEFGLPADFAGPGATKHNPVKNRKPAAAPPRVETPIEPQRVDPTLMRDPLLKEALEHWRGRMTAADLDMARWLDRDFDGSDQSRGD